MNISLDGKDINQVDGSVYRGGMVNEDGHSEVEVRCRIQQGANAWGKVEGFMLDRNILKRLKRKMLRACVTPACLYLYMWSGFDRTTSAASLVLGSPSCRGDGNIPRTRAGTTTIVISCLIPTVIF